MYCSRDGNRRVKHQNHKMKKKKKNATEESHCGDTSGIDQEDSSNALTFFVLDFVVMDVVLVLVLVLLVLLLRLSLLGDDQEFPAKVLLPVSPPPLIHIGTVKPAAPYNQGDKEIKESSTK